MSTKCECCTRLWTLQVHLFHWLALTVPYTPKNFMPSYSEWKFDEFGFVPMTTVSDLVYEDNTDCGKLKLQTTKTSQIHEELTTVHNLLCVVLFAWMLVLYNWKFCFHLGVVTYSNRFCRCEGYFGDVPKDGRFPKKLCLKVWSPSKRK